MFQHRSRSRWLKAIRSVSMEASAIHESGHFYFAQTGHSHFAATQAREALSREGYAMFDYDAASGTFAPATKASKPPVGHDAKCGAACHEIAASKDYIFTAYPKR